MGKSPKEQMVRISDYVHPPQAAEIIGCTPGRVYQKLRAGEFKDVLDLGDGRYMIGRKEVQKEASSPAKTGRPRKSLAS
jgi:hypothetical protein